MEDHKKTVHHNIKRHETETYDSGKYDDEKPVRVRRRKKKHSNHSTAKSSVPSKTLLLHGGFVALILLIAVIGIVKLVMWNKGRESDYDPNEISTEFDTETEDYLLPLDSKTAELQKDDGVNTILLLGNDQFARERGENGIDGQIASLTGGTVYNCSFDNTYLGLKNTVYSEDYPTDAFNLYWVVMCMTMNDYTLLENTSKQWDRDDNAPATIETLKNLDLSTVDTVVIMYDGNDFLSERILAGPYDETTAVTCCGCLQQSILLLKQTFPQMRIIVSSPYFTYAEDEDGNLQPGSLVDYGQGTLPDYMIAYKNIAVNNGVSFIDNYFGSITEDNYSQYLQEDRFNLNDAGRALIAKRIAEFIG